MKLREAVKAAVRQLPGFDSLYPEVARRAFYAKHNARDLYDSYLARPLSPRRTPQGFQFTGLGSQHHLAMQGGTFEPDEVRLLTALLGSCERFIDVGANIGFYSCLARSLGKPVVAFEPLPKNLSVLFENLRLNDWLDTEVLPLGVSNRPGLATLFGASSTGASLIDNWAGAPSLVRRMIALTTLDAVLGGRFEGERLLVKMDVEGHEFAALSGASALLGRRLKPTWLVEITLNDFHPGGPSPDFLPTFDLFFRADYSVFLVREGRLERVQRADVERWVAAGRTPAGALNYLFTADEAAVSALLG